MSCYRGLVPVGQVPGGEHFGLTFFLGPGRHLVAYPVRGGELINFVAYVPDQDWTLESWSARSEAGEAVAAFAGWTSTVTTMLGHAGEVGRWALYDREPLRRWSTDRVTLLGDAAHPMLPHAGQGTNQAIEDAAALAACLSAGEPVGALQRYERLRKARTRQIQLGSRGNAACFQLPDGPPADERNARLASLPEMVGWIHSYDIYTALAQPAPGLDHALSSGRPVVGPPAARGCGPTGPRKATVSPTGPLARRKEGDMASEDFTTEAAEGDRDRRFHGGSPAHLDDDELARRTEAERAEAGVSDYDPNDVPAATDDPVPFDPDFDSVEQDIESVTARQEAEGETTPLSADNPFPPTRYAE
jgi:hypothetical protein